MWRLVVVADDEEIAVDGREKLNDLELHGVGILELVHVNIAELAREILARLRVRSQQPERLGEKIVEIERIVRFEMRGVLFIHLNGGLRVALVRGVAGILRGRKPQHFGVGDMPLDGLQKPVVVLIAALLERLLDDGGALLFRIDGKVLAQPPPLGEHPQDLYAHRVDGAYPHAGDVGHDVEPLAHFGGGFVGERDGEDILGRNAQIGNKVRDARREHARFSAPRACEHQNRALGIEDGQALFFVKTPDIYHTRSLYHNDGKMTIVCPPARKEREKKKAQTRLQSSTPYSSLGVVSSRRQSASSCS